MVVLQQNSIMKEKQHGHYKKETGKVHYTEQMFLLFITIKKKKIPENMVDAFNNFSQLLKF